ncbi:MAG: universal stress protein [Ruminococcaceae bacterium]|nr:universal stress protein [Oscillospiraceae bacterium]
MKTVLVPIDGSDCTELAVTKAREMADFYHAKLIIMNIYDIPTLRSYFDFDTENREDNILQDLRARSKKTLETARGFIPDFSDDRIELVSLEGDPADRIVDYAKLNDVELIVMGSHGMGTFRRFFLGSVSHKVVVQAETPVMII